MKKILVLGEIEVKRSRGWQRMRWLNSIPDSVDMNLNKLGNSRGQGSWHAAIHEITKSLTGFSK